MSSSQTSLSSPDEKFVGAVGGGLAGQKTTAPMHVDEKARRSGRFKMDIIITGFSILLYLMSYVSKVPTDFAC
jgi:hypothetical protein